ncbi:MAG: diaminopimelate epimerase [Pseudomonadota bacterium]
MTPASTLSPRPFRKMNGLGNAFVVVDLRAGGAMDADAAVRIADRSSGVGCDQVITLETRDGAPFMGVWNADGSEVGACGNAARCVGWLLMQETGDGEARFHTLSGPLHAIAAGDRRVTVDMGPPRLRWDEIPLRDPAEDTRFVDVKLGPIDAPVLWGPSAVSMGNPHCVFFVDDAEAQAIDKFGPLIEHHPMFPEGCNVSVAQVLSDAAIRLRVWERGAGITKACGTAACAALVSAVRRGRTQRTATVMMDGGPLDIEWAPDDHVRMTGPVELEFEGVLD